MSSLLLCRAAGRTSTFNRSVRDEDGNTVKVLSFAPGAPLLVEGDDLIAVMQDVGRAIVIVEVAKDRPDSLSVKYEETAAFMLAELGQVADFSDERHRRIKQVEPIQEPGASIEISDEIFDILNQPENLELLGGEATPESVAKFVADGNELTKLKDIGKGRATALSASLGL